MLTLKQYFFVAIYDLFKTQRKVFQLYQTKDRLTSGFILIKCFCLSHKMMRLQLKVASDCAYLAPAVPFYSQPAPPGACTIKLFTAVIYLCL
jgi:hypothetical protein